MPDLDGEYEVRAQIVTVNGRPADLPSPQLRMSLYRDGALGNEGQVKAIIDDQRTLLVPRRVRMAGSVYEDDTARFIVSGSFELPEDATGENGNPYQVPLRRDITLIGERRDPLAEGGVDALLGPTDLKGEYRETIRNVLGEPIYLEGTFTASYVTGEVGVIDRPGAPLQGGPFALEDGSSRAFRIPVGEDLIYPGGG